MRYVGCSNFLAYRLARALGRSEALGVARFVSVQPRYNLLFREFERELFPLCLERRHRRDPVQPDRGRHAVGQARPHEGARRGHALRARQHDGVPNSHELAALTQAAELVELGSGTASKTRVLLSALHEAGTLRRYVPVDVTESMVRECAAELTVEYPGLQVHGVIGDFERHLGEIPESVGPRIVAFLGGTIGNFPPGSRRRILREISRLLGPEDHLLIGTDLVKDPRVLQAAYDDAQGVTARVQPQRPTRAQSRARRRLRARRLRPCRAVQRRA